MSHQAPVPPNYLGSSVVILAQAGIQKLKRDTHLKFAPSSQLKDGCTTKFSSGSDKVFGSYIVIPAQAGIQCDIPWISAFAEMTSPE
ncbi:hypothetical protein UN63_11935 [Oceanisphaera arctica]|uniref:Uncharacterized protein n=1 Tax=Oceanisphaera arctica TaxID=641510 RepID=A0A2P5TKH5_9GAMM|nr:hypothetical protein UN63_11935 [Oceanisphaera arctica]GHA25926.1 hypothetical protein GCM10007082_27930 [Oceanisphaera arctica]